MSSQYNTGMGTTPGMWEMASEALEGEKLPESVNSALYSLCKGEASVVPDAVELPTPELPVIMGVGPAGTYTEVPKNVMDGLYKIMCGLTSDFSGHEVAASAKPGMEAAMRFVLEYGGRNGFDMRS